MSYEKALNELKKATMAAYLAKAGGHVRADTSIAKSFDDDVFRHMKVVNQHSPYNVNGAEKDPEKLAHATKQMNVNAELRDQFKRGAQNRIKGIARAGRLLAKEEAIVEAGKNPYGPGYKLVDKEGNELKVGHKFMHTSHHEGSKPEHHEITGWQSGEQRGNSSSSGRVSVKVGKGKKAYNTEYFPHVFDMKVVKEDVDQMDEEGTFKYRASPSNYRGRYFMTIKKDNKRIGTVMEPLGGDDENTWGFHHDASSVQKRGFKNAESAHNALQKHHKGFVKEDAEPVNELKTSTLASVATKRYAQAQAALKAKDFGGYVKGMKKSQTAADATVPKSGWSPEDDKKNEEVDGGTGFVSAQEKYRQIREAKVKKAVKKDYASGKGMRAYGDPPKGNVDYPNDPRNPKPKKVGE